MASSLPDVQVVVARYKEDLSWTRDLDLPVLVYDKSGESLVDTVDGLQVRPLPNMGRESHTYLHHLVTQYDNLAPFTAFLQGSCIDHLAPGENAKTLSERIKELAARKAPFKGLADFSIRCDALGRPHNLRDPEFKGRWAGWGKDIPLGEVYAKLFSGPVPESFHIRAPAGLLFVSRERVRLRPLGLYKLALSLSEADPDDANNTGHALERLWYLMFNGYAALNRDDYTL